MMSLGLDSDCIAYSEPIQDDSGIRVLTIPRKDIGFGFNVRGQVGEGGNMTAINGELYGPLHQVTALIPGGSAECSGLKTEDRILEINGINVEGCMHKNVIEMLRSSKDSLILTVITPLINKRKVNQNDNSREMDKYRISIPDYQLNEDRNESYIVYNIYIDGRLASCRRYKHFDKLHSIIRSQFPRHHFHALPGKKLFALNDHQLMERRVGLEKFLVSACSISEVIESNAMKQFLLLDDNGKEECILVPMKILMPDHSLLNVLVNPEECTEQIYERVVNLLQLRTDMLPYFALFEVTKENFERKLTTSDNPFKIFSKHKNLNLSSGISFKKWIFSPSREVVLCRDPLVLSLIHSEEIEKIKSGEILMGDRRMEVENLNEFGKHAEVLEIVRQLEGYGSISFPHCASESRKNGHVVCSVSYVCLKLVACTSTGASEDGVLELEWNRVISFEAQPTTFTFNFSRDSRKPRTITLTTKYSNYMSECFERILTERKEDELMRCNMKLA